MRNDKFSTSSVRETQKIGEDIAKKLRGGEIVFLSGILGAGKTELIRGIARGLGIKTKVSSPTFNIFRIYNFIFPRRNIACHVPIKGRLYHFDCYRLRKYSDLVDLGWKEILAEENSIVVLEWPECIVDADITKLRNKKIISVEIEISKNDTRIFDIEYKTLLPRLKGMGRVE